MKKIYLLMGAVLLSVTVFAQTTEAGRAYLKGRKAMNHVVSPDRLSSPDTTGIVNVSDFLPEFLPGGGSASIYGYLGGGYIFGNNVDNLKICGQGYDNLNNIPVNIIGALLWFGGQEMDAASGSTSRMAIQTYAVVPNRSYNTTGSGSVNTTSLNWPGPAVGAASQTVDLMFADVDTVNFNYVAFPTVHTYIDDFVIVMDVTNLAAGDTVGLVSDNQNDAGNIDYSWHKIGTKWYVTDQVFSDPVAPSLGSGGLDNNIAMWAVLEDATGVNEFFNGMKLTTYPNPAVETVTVEYTLEQNSKGVSLVVFDQTGRKVVENKYNTQTAGTYKATINATELAAGNYFYQLNANGRNFTKKFVVTK